MLNLSVNGHINTIHEKNKVGAGGLEPPRRALPPEDFTQHDGFHRQQFLIVVHAPDYAFTIETCVR